MVWQNQISALLSGLQTAEPFCQGTCYILSFPVPLLHWSADGIHSVHYSQIMHSKYHKPESQSHWYLPENYQILCNHKYLTTQFRQRTAPEADNRLSASPSSESDKYHHRSGDLPESLLLRPYQGCLRRPSSYRPRPEALFHSTAQARPYQRYLWYRICSLRNRHSVTEFLLPRSYRYIQ